MSDHPDRQPNRLAGETSPYLRQHAHNPVDWFPWGREALEKAWAEDRPIFLSIGYSACHWCHVMERESFEDERIARFLNEHFVPIKVDREERPDLDQIYMAAVQAMTGHGGWPMSVFLTPNQKPFYGGTYFPPTDRQGMPGFDRVLESVARAWTERKQNILEAADNMSIQLADLGLVAKSDQVLDFELLDRAVQELRRSFDSVNGGFGPAPRFPRPMDLKLLLRHFARTGDAVALHMVRFTLDKMARGGIFDHLGGGFARYSTDVRWLVPHFEKMLYDNALLAQVYLEAFQIARAAEYAQVARETIESVLGRMTGPAGGFYATEDADSEGVEGKYYVWSLAEIQEVLGAERSETFASVYDVTEAGNWEGHNILNLPRAIADVAKNLGRDPADLHRELAEDRSKLLAARERRVPPGKDTKVLASWNGLMLAALAEAGLVLKEPRYLQAAERAAGFVLDHMRQPDGRLWHGFQDGQARFNAYLDDYACLIDGLTRLFEATGGPRWIEAAVELAETMIDQFADHEAGGFFYTGQGHETLIVRPKDLIDGATPSGNAMAATALLRLGALTGRASLSTAGRSAIETLEAAIRSYPTATTQSLIALDLLLTPAREIAIIAGADPDEFRAVRERAAEHFRPHAVVAPAPGPVADTLTLLVPLLANRPAHEGHTTTYVCEQFTCLEPVVGLEGLEATLIAKLLR